MRQAVLKVEIWTEQLGWLRMLATSLLIIGACSLIIVSPFEYLRLQKIEAETRLSNLPRNELITPAPEQSEQSNLERFRQVLGDAGGVDSYIKDIFLIARGLNISLDEGRYQRSESAAGFSSLGVELPIVGNYQAIRDFCRQVLVIYPFASLDEITFRRENTEKEELSAKVHFTLFLSDRRRQALSQQPTDH